MKLLQLLFALFVCQLLLPMQASAMMSHAEVYRMLKQGSSPFVRKLPPGEREILMATLALEALRSNEAIELLNSANVGKDPVASRLRAEAYRRASIQAAMRAGKYAHAVAKDIGKLEHANIDLAPAKLRLQAFIDRVEVGQKLAVAAYPLARAAPLAHAEGATLLESVRQAIESWIRDWQSRNAEAYLSHYHAQFSAGKYDFASWSAHKRRINGKKSYIRVGISKLRLISGPTRVIQGEGVLVGFRQQYKSSNYSANSNKQLYLVRERPGAPWMILREGNTVHVPEPVAARQLPEQTPAVSGPVAWTINIGSFTSAANAQKMLAGIHLPGSLQPVVEKIAAGGKTIYRVRLGKYARQADAADAMRVSCAKLGLADCWLQQVKR